MHSVSDVQDSALASSAPSGTHSTLMERWNTIPFLGGARIAYIINTLHFPRIRSAPDPSAMLPSPSALHLGSLREQETPLTLVWNGYRRALGDADVLAHLLATGQKIEPAVWNAITMKDCTSVRDAAVSHPDSWFVTATEQLADIVNGVLLALRRAVPGAGTRVYPVTITQAGNAANIPSASLRGGLRAEERTLTLCVGVRIRLLEAVVGADDMLGTVTSLDVASITVALRSGTSVEVKHSTRPGLLVSGQACTVSSMPVAVAFAMSAHDAQPFRLTPAALLFAPTRLDPRGISALPHVHALPSMIASCATLATTTFINAHAAWFASKGLFGLPALWQSMDTSKPARVYGQSLVRPITELLSTASAADTDMPKLTEASPLVSVFGASAAGVAHVPVSVVQDWIHAAGTHDLALLTDVSVVSMGAAGAEGCGGGDATGSVDAAPSVEEAGLA
jgi:hypothetical protein